MNRQKLSAKEAALIAAARAGLSGADSAPPESEPVRDPAPAMATPPVGPPATDPAALAERLASLIQAERESSQRRMRRMKTAGTAIAAVAALPIMAWAVVTLVSQLIR